MQQLETRSDEELEAETRYKAAAQAILGARAAERYDAKAARAHFQRALAAARPQERLQLRRMADASLALAERRADDLKKATERLGMEAPSGRQLFGLKLFGLIAPPASAGMLARIRGIMLVIALIIVVLLLGFGIVNLIALPFGGISVDLRDLLRLPARADRPRRASRTSGAGAAEAGAGRPRGAGRRALPLSAPESGVRPLHAGAPDPGRRAGPVPDRRGDRGRAAVQRRARRRRAGRHHRPRGRTARASCCAGGSSRRGPRARRRG